MVGFIVVIRCRPKDGQILRLACAIMTTVECLLVARQQVDGKQARVKDSMMEYAKRRKRACAGNATGMLRRGRGNVVGYTYLSKLSRRMHISLDIFEYGAIVLQEYAIRPATAAMHWRIVITVQSVHGGWVSLPTQIAIVLASQRWRQCGEGFPVENPYRTR